MALRSSPCFLAASFISKGMASSGLLSISILFASSVVLLATSAMTLSRLSVQNGRASGLGFVTIATGVFFFPACMSSISFTLFFMPGWAAAASAIMSSMSFILRRMLYAVGASSGTSRYIAICAASPFLTQRASWFIMCSCTSGS